MYTGRAGGMHPTGMLSCLFMLKATQKHPKIRNISTQVDTHLIIAGTLHIFWGGFPLVKPPRANSALSTLISNISFTLLMFILSILSCIV